MSGLSFQAYIAVLRRVGQANEFMREAAERAQTITAETAAASGDQLPGEIPPVTLSDLPLGQRFRGN
jgi:hypothetical protein